MSEAGTAASVASSEGYSFLYGGQGPRLHARPRVPITVFTEDCFSGLLSTTGGHPRKVAPYPYVNPLTGPIAVEGIRPGDLLAIHLARLEPARDWGVATVSPDFGALSGTQRGPNLQAPQAEQVWIWTVDRAGSRLTTPASDGSGRVLSAPLRPFHGSLGVAPAHGEVRASVVPDLFGGNLDLPDLAAGATLYLRANVEGAMVSIGDGHFTQGDGELAGTAVEGALRTTLIFDVAPTSDTIAWPRIETDREIGVVGCARPLEDAVRIAAAGVVHWVAHLCGLSVPDAHQWVSQVVRLRIGNLVNPLYTVAAFVPKHELPGAPLVLDGVHTRLRTLTSAEDAP